MKQEVFENIEKSVSSFTTILTSLCLIGRRGKNGLNVLVKIKKETGYC